MTAAVQDQTQDRAGQPTLVAAGLPRVNLLPTEILEVRRLRIVQSWLGALVAVALLVVAGLWVLADREAATEQERLDTVSARQAGLDREAGTLLYVTETYRRVEERQLLLTTAMRGEVLWSRLLTDISLTVPDDVWLTSMTVAPVVPSAESTGTAAAPATVVAPDEVATITFVGKAIDHDDVSVWLETLARQKAFTGVYFSDSKSEKIGSTDVVTFTSTGTVTTAALNPAYLVPAGN